MSDGDVVPGGWGMRGGPSRVSQAVVRVRACVPLLPLDVFLAAAAYSLVLLLRFNGTVPSEYWHAFRLFLPVAIVVHISANWFAGLYGQVWRYASIAEARRVLAAGFGSGVVLFAASFATSLATSKPMPRSVIVLGALVVTYFLGGLRFQSRLFAFNRAMVRSESGVRVAIVGAGNAAASIVREMLDNPQEGLLPVVVVDDDRRKHGLSLLGVPVTGGTSGLAAAVKRFDAQQVVLAVTAADRGLVERVAAEAELAGVPL
ncbi:MAG TPA: hypothetical protein VIK61_16545, partial [Acidimicrobiia bacterium]